MTLLSLLVAVCVSAAPKAWEKLGGGSQALVPQAVSIARANWHKDACLSGLTGHYKGAGTDFVNFHFFSPQDPRNTFSVTFSPGSTSPRPGRGLKEGGDECITEMSVDSGDAGEIARAAGLALRPKDTLILRLFAATEKASLYYGYRALRGRTFWRVDTLHNDGPSVFIDAKTGKILAKGAAAKNLP